MWRFLAGDIQLSRRTTLKLGVLAVMAGTNVGIWYFLPYYIVDLGGTIIEVGLISTIPSLVAAFVQLSAGAVVDEFRTAKRLLELGFLLATIFTLPLLIVGTTTMVILCAAVLETFNSITIIWGVTNSMYMAQLTPERHRARIMSIYSASWFLGNIGGSFIAGYLALVSWRGVFAVYALVSLVTGGFVKYVLPTDAAAAPRYSTILREFFRGRRLINACRHMPEVLRRSTTAFTAFTGGLSIRSIGVAMIMPLISVYLATVLQASKPMIATLSSVNAGSRIVLSPVAGWMADTIGRKRVFLFGLIVMIVYPLLIVVTPTVQWLYPAYLLMGLGWACNQATYLAWQMTLMPPQRGQAMGVLSFLNYLSWAVGPAMGGVLGEYAGIEVGVIAATVIETLGLIILIRVPETLVKAPQSGTG